MLKVLLSMVLMLSLSACQYAPVRDEDSPLMRISPGSRIILNKPLTVPAGHARVFLQNGKVVVKTRLNRYHPHCNFEVKSVSDGALRIEADTFIVTEVSEREEEVVSYEQPLRLAGLNLIGGDALPMLTLSVRHRLHSERQPEVMRLTCHGGFDDPWKVAYPSITNIRQSLGDLATLELADR